MNNRIIGIIAFAILIAMLGIVSIKWQHASQHARTLYSGAMINNVVSAAQEYFRHYRVLPQSFSSLRKDAQGIEWIEQGRDTDAWGRKINFVESADKNVLVIGCGGLGESGQPYWEVRLTLAKTSEGCVVLKRRVTSDPSGILK